MFTLLCAISNHSYPLLQKQKYLEKTQKLCKNQLELLTYTFSYAISQSI